MLSEIIKGLLILEQYNAQQQAYFSAEHDEIYVGGPRPAKMSAEHRHLLRDTGWRYQESHEAWHRFV